MSAPEPLAAARLVDVLPALRHVDERLVAERLEDVRLTAGWWARTPLTEVERVIGREALTHVVALTLRALWPHTPIGEALPVLGSEDGRTVAVVARSAGAGLAAGDRALARLFGRVLETLPVILPGSVAADEVEVIARWLPDTAPEEVRRALERLRGRLTPPPAPALPDPLEAVERLVSGWEERMRVIAARRLFTARPDTLAALGHRFLITRERARQLERHAAERIGHWLIGRGPHAAEGRAFAGHLAELGDRFGAVARLSEVYEAHPRHVVRVPGLDVRLGEVVARLLPDREATGAWVVRGDPGRLRTETRAALLAVCEHGPVPWERAEEVGARFGIRPEVLPEWVLDLGRFRILDGLLAHWSRSVADRAAVVLAVVGRPLAFDELHTRLDDGTAPASLRNQITGDPRFLRVDRNRYGLRAWGGEEYLGIREMITREILRAGGEAEAHAVVEALTERFDVTASSVRSNLHHPEFARAGRGRVRLAGAEDDRPAEAYRPRRDVAGTRRCFRGVDGRWWYRLEVGVEHLRGSGTSVPTGWAVHIGGSPLGEPVTFAHLAGETTLQWRTQPILGTLRPLLEHLGAGLGDLVFLNVADGRLDALRLPHTGPDLAPAHAAARLTGWAAPADRTEALALIARRVDLPGADEVALIDRLLERGDRDVAHLLRAPRPALSGPRGTPAAPSPAS
ncbi:hypothetical protein ACN20G_04075 [Streptomyces sp. BI20]|uniref:hypothetical protein n=1 Tax=Streptomyces sp. BI20 TaxID=3403460 RepID=UPI003C73F8BD